MTGSACDLSTSTSIGHTYLLAAIGICPLAAISGGYPAVASFVTERDRGLGAGALEPSIWTVAQSSSRRRAARRSDRIFATTPAWFCEQTDPLMLDMWASARG
jgi:hypothetical protein